MGPPFCGGARGTLPESRHCRQGAAGRVAAAEAQWRRPPVSQVGYQPMGDGPRSPVLVGPLAGLGSKPNQALAHMYSTPLHFPFELIRIFQIGLNLLKIIGNSFNSRKKFQTTYDI
jgi:hypothetical protein